MKTEVVKKEEIKFSPIEIKLIIETEEDLAWLWAVSNGSVATARKNCSLTNYSMIKHILENKDINHSQMVFFDIIDKIVTIRGYNK
jgi:hypothetical protein